MEKLESIPNIGTRNDTIYVLKDLSLLALTIPEHSIQACRSQGD